MGQSERSDALRLTNGTAAPPVNSIGAKKRRGSTCDGPTSLEGGIPFAAAAAIAVSLPSDCKPCALTELITVIAAAEIFGPPCRAISVIAPDSDSGNLRLTY